jgi:hypothetical protein
MQNQTEVNLQSTRDQQDNARILHDAELIRGGASMHDSRLEVTREQVVALKHTRRHDKAAGVMLRLSKDPKEDELIMSGDIDEWEQGIENSTELQAHISAITAPYYDLLTSFLPAAADNKKNWRGKVKTTNELVEVKFDKTLDNRPLTYSVDLYYEKSLVHNQLMSGNIQVAPRDSTRRYATNDADLSISAESGAVVSGHFSTVHSMKTAAEIKLMGDLPDRVEPIAHNSFSFKTVPGEESITFYGYGNSALKYSYDDEQDAFVLSTDSVITKEMPRTLTTREYLDCLQSTLQIIPTETVDLN